MRQRLFGFSQLAKDDEIITFAELQANLLHLADEGSPHLRPKRFNDFQLISKCNEGLSQFVNIF